MVFLRYILYILIPTVFMELFVLITRLGYAKFLFEEDTFMEWAQFSCLTIICLIFYIAGKKHIDMKEGFRILMLIPLIAAVRELDRFFEHLLFEHAWKVFASIILVYFIYELRKNFQVIKKQLHLFFNTRAFGLMFSGFLICISFSQIIGQKIFWRALMQEHYYRLVARTVEECGELFGYLIILMGTIECLLQKNYTEKEYSAYIPSVSRRKEITAFETDVTPHTDTTDKRNG